MQFDESWYAQPQDAISLGDLPAYWLHNKTFMTPDKAEKITERCAEEYWDLCRRESPELASERNPDEPAPEITEQAELEWKEKQGAFFADVHGIEKYDFKKQPHSPGWTAGSLLDSRFGQWFPEYVQYRMDEITAHRVKQSKGHGDISGEQVLPSLSGFDLTRDAVVPAEPEIQANKVPDKTVASVQKEDVTMPKYGQSVGRDVSGLKDIGTQDGLESDLRY